MSILKRFHRLFSRNHKPLTSLATIRRIISHMEKQTLSLLDVQQWQAQEILAGIAEADAGQVIEHSKVKAMAALGSRPNRS